MGLYIKGLDMPKSCSECLLADRYIDISCQKVYYCMVSDKECVNGSEKRADSCPLIEIPTPHGRLIDGDIVADMLDSMMAHKTLHNAFDEVLNMPTIIESED